MLSRGAQVQLWGPHHKDHRILGSILGSPYLGEPPDENMNTGGKQMS